MTHDQKLDQILRALHSRMPVRMEPGKDDDRLNFEFICKALFVDEDHEAWETEYLKRRLIDDGYLSFVNYCDVQLPEITNKGIKFIQRGGYVKERELTELNEELLLQNLRNAKRSWIAIVIAIISLLITILTLWIK